MFKQFKSKIKNKIKRNAKLSLSSSSDSEDFYSTSDSEYDDLQEGAIQLLDTPNSRVKFDISFYVEKDYENTILKEIPVEIRVSVLTYLKTTDLVNFSKTSKSSYILVQNENLWKPLCYDQIIKLGYKDRSYIGLPQNFKSWLDFYKFVSDMQLLKYEKPKIPKISCLESNFGDLNILGDDIVTHILKQINSLNDLKNISLVSKRFYYLVFINDNLFKQIYIKKWKFAEIPLFSLSWRLHFKYALLRRRNLTCYRCGSRDFTKNLYAYTGSFRQDDFVNHGIWGTCAKCDKEKNYANERTDLTSKKAFTINNYLVLQCLAFYQENWIVNKKHTDKWHDQLYSEFNTRKLPANFQKKLES